MLSKFTEWLEFHATILDAKSGPMYTFLVGCVLTIIILFFYNYNIINVSEAPFVDKLISKHRNYLKHGCWIIPLAGFLISLCTAICKHRKNIRKIYD